MATFGDAGEVLVLVVNEPDAVSMNQLAQPGEGLLDKVRRVVQTRGRHLDPVEVAFIPSLREPVGLWLVEEGPQLLPELFQLSLAVSLVLELEHSLEFL